MRCLIKRVIDYIEVEFVNQKVEWDKFIREENETKYEFILREDLLKLFLQNTF